MSIDLKSLGFTEAELRERIIDQICEEIMVILIKEETASPVVAGLALLSRAS